MLTSSPVTVPPGAPASAAIAHACKQPYFISRGNSSKPPKHFDLGKVFIPVKIRKLPWHGARAPERHCSPRACEPGKRGGERARQANKSMATACITGGLAQDGNWPCTAGTGPCPLPGPAMMWGDPEIGCLSPWEMGWPPPGTQDSACNG